jgi:putative transposase
VGIDLGLTQFAVLSDGRKVDAPRIARKTAAKLHTAQRELARTRLARSVNDAGWSTFTAMLEYKALRHGRTFARVDRWLPSTRGLLGVRGDRRGQAVARPRVGMPVRHGARPGRQRRPQHPRRRTGGEQRNARGAGVSQDPVPQPAVKREPAGSTA